jgi:hypothetical protein
MQWTGPLSDGERIVVLVDGPGVSTDGHLQHEVDRGGRGWVTRSYRREDLIDLATDIRTGAEVRGRRLRPACRVVAGTLDDGLRNTALQRMLVDCGLGEVVLRRALMSARSALEHSHASAASRDWPRACLAMGEAIGHVCDAVATQAGELWPGRRWRLDRLRAVASGSEHDDTTIDELCMLLLSQGLELTEPRPWFAHARSIVHETLVRIEARDD